jgi:hypothetical protein
LSIARVARSGQEATGHSSIHDELIRAKSLLVRVLTVWNLRRLMRHRVCFSEGMSFRRALVHHDGGAQIDSDLSDRALVQDKKGA